MAWLAEQIDDNHVQCTPIGDTIEHQPHDDCVCGPRTEPCQRDDGSIGWLIVHHSLDGREQREANHGH